MNRILINICGGWSRRDWFIGIASLLLPIREACAQPESTDCPRCGGLNRIPLNDAKPFVWLKGTTPLRPEQAIGEQGCPVCQKHADRGEIVANIRQQMEAALDKHRQWEDRTGWKLQCVVTRHAVVHTQLSAAHARSVGMAMENLTLHLKRVAESLLLTPTRPDTLELMLLWEKPSWEQFRKVMEQVYSFEQLGEAWGPSRDYNAYDHALTPHMYETPQSVRTRPPSCGATFMIARRQLHIATQWNAPFWLTEGFAAYGDYIVHKSNRWFSVYAVKQVPVGDWMVEARKLAAEGRLRSWAGLFKIELRDWEPADHFQTMAVVAFLLESEPGKFLAFLNRLKTGNQPTESLEKCYGQALDDLEQRFTRWILARR